jgi:transcriptional regulator GlxA family with amidase domain
MTVQRRRLCLLITGMAATAGLVAAAVASASQWRLPDNVISATAPGYEYEEPTMRAPVEGRDKRLVVVLADNEGTETTDFIVPYAMLKESGAADVRAVSTEAGAVELMPALRVQAEETIPEFEQREPAGADVVIVPAMHYQDNPAILDFLRNQAAAGALIVAICDGAWVVANAGLFEGRKATGHWFSFNSLARKFPDTMWVRDARIVSDVNVMSTTGVSASIPISLALIEILSDRQTARALAAKYGVNGWSDRHDSDAFGLSPRMMWTGIANLGAIWRHEELMVSVSDRFDEIALALQADAWSRTFRSTLSALNPGGEVVSSRGLTFLTEVEQNGGIDMAMVPSRGENALEDALDAIEARYGTHTAEFVATQLEYDRSPRSQEATSGSALRPGP